MDKNLIRNFSIIAHIDHGKSTLADRLMEFTHSVDKRQFRDQLLDDMDLERERGITIKASAVKIEYKAKDGKTYLLNLIDTPGHVDFSYEVSKSIAACEGVVLLVDAAQGVEAQTVANLYLALEHNLCVIPVINKIDLQNADIDRTEREIRDILGLKTESIIRASAKEGTGTEAILEAVVKHIPAPKGDERNPLQSLIFDSSYNTYRGVIIYTRVMNGEIKPGMRIKMMNTGNSYEVKETGIFDPKPFRVDSLSAGEVGYVTCNIKNAKEVIIGDTITSAEYPAKTALKGYKRINPMVFCGIYPANTKDYEALKEAIDKLRLSDSSFVFEAESSAALGYGFRCGFLGLLHIEIIQERLHREYELDLISTTPSVIYKIYDTFGNINNIDNPSKYPDPQTIEHIEEPYVKIHIIFPKDYLGDMIELCKSRRGEYISTNFLDPKKVEVIFEMPLAEIITDFYDKIKSLSRGYGSMDYEIVGYRPTNIAKLDILINAEICDALSFMVHRDKAEAKGRALLKKLKEEIPRHLFKIALQASIGGNIVAREDISAVGKHVTSKCYGGDITRKRKLWAKQKEGKKKMRRFGKVEIPQKAFWAALKI
ncbi:MAG: elongation factor 4 [Candidatus Omnitrophica bacterium]|nr:elongation factor 4 [Candidatus Omnitrophota bacterium]